MWTLRGPLEGDCEEAVEHVASRAAELRSAIALLDFAEAFALLDAEAANCRDPETGWCAVHACAAAGSKDLLQMVLAARAEVNVRDASGRTALALAVKRGDAELSRLLLDAGAAVDEVDDGGGLASDAAPEPARRHADVRNLMEERERPSKYGQVLLRAIAQKDARTAEAAIEAGGDVNSTDERGDGPLLLLAKGSWRGCEGPQVRLAERCVAAGAAVGARSRQGSTPLLYAAHRGSCSLVEALLRLRADVAAANDEGNTALMYAAHGGHEATCTVLLEAFAPCKARNKFGLTAEQLANRQGFRSCAVLIQAYEMAPKRPGEDAEELPRRRAKKQEEEPDYSNWGALERLLQEQDEQEGEEASLYKQAMAMMRGERSEGDEARQKRTGAFDYSRWEKIVDELEKKEELQERRERLEQSPEFLWRGGSKMRVMV